jgi:nitronate monooxygenase
MSLLPPATSDFIARFGLRYPILQAPTGSIAGPELAIAVTNAGGMGALALTWTPPDLAAKYVQRVREAASGPFLVNFALAFPPLALSAALEQGAPIVSFSWGDPAPFIAQVRSAGAKWGVQVTNEAGARYALALGADFLICQGIEAGGHVQSTTLLHSLLPRLVKAVGATPVIASGGMATGADIARVLQQGASAAMLGTRFVATQESRAHEGYKQKLVQSTADDAALTTCFEGGWPYAAHRVLRNATLEAWEAAGCPPVGQRPGEGDVTGATPQGEPIYRYEDTAPRIGFTGDIEAMCLYAGTGCGSIQDVPPAGEIMQRLWEECTAVLP